MAVLSCTRCGAENREGRRFCAECGGQLPASCASCGFLNEGGEKFCGGCGAPLARTDATRIVPPAADWYGERDLALRAEHLDRADAPEAPRAYLDAATDTRSTTRSSAANIGVRERTPMRSSATPLPRRCRIPTS